jgi:type IV pilus assembly protein PilY1
MSRMDTMRKVLYGGYRSTDTASETVLERAFIPQDAHSWGKEYESIQRDGYDIRDYTPLSLPAPDTRHLFANTTLSNTGPPLMRVLTNSIYRIWEWVAIERPVAGSYCLDGRPTHGTLCTTSGGESWEMVPPSAFESLTQTTYDTTGRPAHPMNHADFNALQATYGIEARKDGSGAAANINGSGNPFGADDYYMTIFEGKINIPSDGTYEFAVDGDDAVELMINGTVVAHFYGGHPRCNCQTYNGSIYLTAGQHDLVFRHEEGTVGDSYHLYWKRTIPSSAMTDYHVRVQVGVASMPEPNCKQYGGATGPYKPTGLLQKHGETDKMYFGLMTGSFAKNTSGGVLRKNIGSIKDEIDPDTGQFTNVNGIIQTINTFRIVDFRYYDYSYEPGWPGAWILDRPMNEGEFPDWGNPIGEMMYETLRYFADGETATPDYNYSGTSRDATLGLPQPAWSDPFLQPDSNGDPLDLYCAKPIMLVISDINPSYDSDQLPGSAFAAGGWSGGRT